MRAKENVMDLEQEIERIMDELAEGNRSRHGLPYVWPGRVYLAEKLRELSDIVAAFTRKQALEEVKAKLLACDDHSKSSDGYYSCCAHRIAYGLQKGEEQP